MIIFKPGEMAILVDSQSKHGSQIFNYRRHLITFSERGEK
jgi:hypothetical protein